MSLSVSVSVSVSSPAQNFPCEIKDRITIEIGKIFILNELIVSSQRIDSLNALRFFIRASAETLIDWYPVCYLSMIGGKEVVKR